MALNVGSLVGHLSVDSDQMDDGMARGERSFRDFGGRIGGIAKAAGIAAGVLVVAALGSAFMAALERERIGRSIAAALGEGGDSAGKYGKLAGKIYSQNFGQSVAEIGETLKAVLRAPDLVDRTDIAAVEDLTIRAQVLADAFGLEVTGSVRAAQQMIRNKLAPDAKTAFDIIAAGAVAGLDSSEDLLDTLNEYGTKFRDLGLDAKQALGLLSQGLRAGARDTDTVADSLKEFAIRARDGSTVAAAGFKALGLDASKMTAIFAKGGKGAADGLQLVLDRLRAMEDPVARDAAAVALFGTKAEDLGQSLFALDPSSAVAALGKVTGAVDDASAALGSGAANSLETFKRQMSEKLINLLEERVIPALNKFGDWFTKNQNWAEPVATGLALITVAVAALTVGMWALNAAMAVNPLTWIVIAFVVGFAILAAQIAFIVFVIVQFYKHWDEIWAKVSKTGEKWWNAVVDFFSGLGGKISGALSSAWATVVGWWNTALAWLTGLPGRAGAALAALPGAIGAAARTAMTDAAYAIGAGAANIINFLVAWPGQVWTALSALPGLVGGLFSAAWEWARTATVNGANAAIDYAMALPGRAASALSSLGSRIAGLFWSAWSWAKAVTVGGVNDMVGWLQGLPGRLWGIGTDAVNGLINGIRNQAGRLWGLAWDMASSFLQGFKDALRIGSPSRVMFDLGVGGIGEGLLRGIKKMVVPVEMQARVLGAAATAGVGSSVGTASGPAPGYAPMPALLARTAGASVPNTDATVRVILSGTGVLSGVRELVRVKGGDSTTVLAGT